MHVGGHVHYGMMMIAPARGRLVGEITRTFNRDPVARVNRIAKLWPRASDHS